MWNVESRMWNVESKMWKVNDFLIPFSSNVINDLYSFSLNFFRFPGVADGVGGWRSYGIDPGEFSSFLMKTCERLVQSANFCPKQPVSLLAYSYCELLEQKKPILGKSFTRLNTPPTLF